VVDTDVAQFFDNMDANWARGKTTVISIAGFVVALGIFWLAYSKATKKAR
jgi:hypothetical protein